jgi:hypothetical protein
MGEYVYIHVFLTSALAEIEWSASRPSSEGGLGTHWIGGLTGPRASLEKFLTLPGLKL